MNDYTMKYYQTLLNIQKKKAHTYTKHWRTTMNPWLWRHLHFIFKQFSRRKLTHQLLGTSSSFIHELRISVIKFIEEVFYWLDKQAIIEFTLTLTSCPFQIYLAESRMVGIQRVVRFRKVSLFTSQGFSIHYNHQLLTTKDTKRNRLPFSSLRK